MKTVSQKIHCGLGGLFKRSLVLALALLHVFTIDFIDGLQIMLTDFVNDSALGEGARTSKGRVKNSKQT